MQHGASKWAVNCGVGHITGGDANDGHFALEVFAPPVAVESDGDGLGHALARPHMGESVTSSTASEYADSAA